MTTSFSTFVTEQRINLPLLATPENTSGGTYIVTGANVGLGYETAKHLLSLKPKKVILACRNTTLALAAKTSIEASTSTSGIADVWELDLASFDSVKRFADRVSKELDRVDGLILNASVALDKWKLADGHESSVTINIISNFLLAVLVLPKMMECAEGLEKERNPHIVLLTSGAAFMMKESVMEGIKDDPFGKMDKEEETGMTQRYPLTKLVQIYAGLYFPTLIPIERTGVVFNLLTPGLFKSSLSRHARFAMRAQVTIMNMLFGRSIEMSSRSVLHAVVAGKESHGGYLSNCKVRNDLVPEAFWTEEGKALQKRIWDDLAKILDGIVPGCVERVL